MFFLQYVANTSETHPEHGLLGDAFLCCWIDAPTLDLADAVARTEIDSQHWLIREREEAGEVQATDYDEDDENREFYEQALTDKTVYVFHTCPRYPVYWVAAAVEKDGQVAEAHYFLAGASLVGEDDDVAIPGFWDGPHRETALTEAQGELAGSGWTLKEITSHKPCGREDVPEDLQFYYDAAEEDGACLVFVHDGEPPEDGAPETPQVE